MENFQMGFFRQIEKTGILNKSRTKKIKLITQDTLCF